MSRFSKGDREAYRRGAAGNPDNAPLILRVNDIAVEARDLGVPDFERDRMVSVLTAIRLDHALPPIDVTEAGGEAFTHTLYHGRHRLAASIAVGFSLVPAVIVRTMEEIKHSEGMA